MKSLLIILPLIVLLAACGGGEVSNRKSQITVAVAASMKFAFEEIATGFEQKYPEHEIRSTFGASGSFHAQILQGAPFDFYIAADAGYPLALVEEGAASADDYVEYAAGRIAVWVPKGSPIDVEALGVEALRHPSVRRAGMANPRHAPFGVVAEEALRSMGVYDEVKDKLVLGEDVSQALQFVDSGGAQICIVALSLALAPTVKDRGSYWVIPQAHHRLLTQGAVVTRQARNREGAMLLRDYLTGPESRGILRKYGYGLPED